MMFKKILLAYNAGKYSRNADIIIELSNAEGIAGKNDSSISTPFVVNDSLELQFTELLSRDDRYTLTFKSEYQVIPDEGTIYIVNANQFDGGLELGDKIKVYGTLVDNIVDYRNYFNVDDIGYIESDGEVIVFKDNRVISLFFTIT